ncbi:MAG: hypothetical protein HOQ24_09150, partial [Mycobacteriaceae bacterium]|nr:hypothetical protein [Mycobacteriaceae bacterium]
MTTFNTPAAIAAELRIAIGTVRIVAGDRTDTVVDVRPSDPAKSADVKAAAAVSVSYSDVLTVASPKSRGIRTPGSVQVEIALPRGSRINGELALGRFGTEGALNDVAVHVSDGTLTVDHATAARLDAGRGDIALRHAAGSATLTTGTGNIELGVGDGVTVTAHTG